MQPTNVHNKNSLPKAIWALGLVSLFMDVSSELIHSLLPVFMVTVLHTSTFTVGLLEGLAEATALIVKIFSGALSDYFQRRKFLAVLGYGLGALSKPLFALASSIGVVFTARIIDRVGKGIRGAPRDALVADIAPANMRGAAYGLRQTLDSVGAFLGPLLAICFMLLWSNNFRLVFWIAVIPASLAVALLIFGVKEPPLASTKTIRRNPLTRANIQQLSYAYWQLVLFGGLFSLARFSEAFLLLKAEQGGMAIAWIPMVLVVMNIVYAITAYPLGVLADRMSKTRLLALSIVVLCIADIVLAYSQHWPMVLVGVALWGLHMGMSQGLLAALIADHAPANLRGTAFGMYNLISGITLFLASALAGLLWQWQGMATPFWVGAVCCAFAFCLLLRLKQTFAQASI